MSTADGGPAFPSRPPRANPGEFSIGAQAPGMSLRDYFAIHAPEPSKEYALKRAGYESYAGPDPAVLLRGYALARYDYADAMLEARGAD